MIYENIYSLCKAKNKGSIYANEIGSFTPRVKWIIEFLDRENIEFEIDIFMINEKNPGYNIILRGKSERWITAHHDIVNPYSDNANDNSCSIINAIALKKLVPELNVAILDGEEFGGKGAAYLADKMKNGIYGKVEWILNLELTGIGGCNFLIGSDGNNNVLGNRIKSMFRLDEVSVPFNDSVIFRKYGFDSVVINPLPRLETGELDMSILYRCHSMEDSVSKISVNDMKEFTEFILFKIVKD